MTKARNLSLLSTVEVAATTDQTKADIDALGINRGRKNLIINGGMQVAQRGTSHATTGYGSLDRFQLNLSGGSSTLSQETLSLGETAVPANINKYMRLTTTSGNDNLGFVYNIEGVDTIEGVVTLSLYAKGANPAGGNFSVQVRTYFGTGGSPSSDVTLTEQTLTVTASWTRYDFQFTLPSLTGKTKGTNGNDYIQIFIRQPDAGTAAWTADFTGVQLELGSVATDFEHRSYGEELALCQRFCYVFDGTQNQDLMLFGVGSGTATVNCTHLHPVEMRATPTLVTTANSTFSSYSFGAAATGGTPTAFNVSSTMSNKNWFYVDVNCTGNTAGTGSMIRASGTATKLTFDAEL